MLEFGRRAMQEEDEQPNDWEVESETEGAEGAERDDREGTADDWRPPGECGAAEVDSGAVGDGPVDRSPVEPSSGERRTAAEGGEVEGVSELDGIERASGGPLVSPRVVVTTLVILVVLGLLVGPWLVRVVFGHSFGEECHDAGDCRSGVCLTYEMSGNVLSEWTTNERICSYSCLDDGDCPQNSRCFEGEHCAPNPTAGLGDTCTFPWECREGQCVFGEKRPLSGPVDDAPTGIPVYEESGTCVSEESLEERREAREKRRNLEDRLEHMGNSDEGGGPLPGSP